MKWLDAAPKGTQTMTIVASRGANPTTAYRLDITIAGETKTYFNVLTGDTLDANKILLQSHWGGGVEFRGVNVSEGGLGD